MGSSKSQPQQPPPPNPELNKPWRKFDWRQKEALKKKLENFSPSDPNVKEIKILVAGQVGAGKSSFINSIESAFQGRISTRALVNSAEGDSHSFTQKLEGFTIRSGRKPLPFVFFDIMGLEPAALVGTQTEDIISAVFGHVQDGYKLNEEQPLTFQDLEFTTNPNLSDQSFCLVYVIDAVTFQLVEDRLIDKLKIIRKRISDKGIPQVVVMTKVDEACPLVGNDLKMVYTSRRIKEKIVQCSNKLGVPMTNIFPVKNYHEEIDTENDVDVLILKALEQIVQSADDRLLDNEKYTET
ncbi:interferon-induced protein 44-like [Danio rerio]|uniref:Interferon-induced protein 44-like n=1 Tax=Danio rerio TaxID=7955 RepID=A0A8M9PJH7_DANRE|nr:interferon-induced protein 44-like isoform X2 [Danio rerio]|eukprot:XP_021331612.1 interferon-induced protein 44-like isoform X2 [Danio rerio]